ncbi:MAG: type II toxin-antitoxin system VapC family toxin [Candidatus Kapabacteria bacterium]|jgi:PIN domain nuclease of toxin-antitoxin system|nr:type II toxin-antitoxin system VapC family toxin [Candidatus Kapabacteria bacterium]
MKRLLLDTQSFIWMMNAPEKLHDNALRAIMVDDGHLCVSIASPWEMAIKVSIGKLQLEKSVMKIVQQYEEIVQFLPIEAHHLAAVETLPLYHRDPFDRIIIAQAITENIPVVSSDAAFDGYGVKRIWD